MSALELSRGDMRATGAVPWRQSGSGARIIAAMGPGVIYRTMT
jgi:hypothetical protein